MIMNTPQADPITNTPQADPATEVVVDPAMEVIEDQVIVQEDHTRAVLAMEEIIENPAMEVTVAPAMEVIEDQVMEAIVDPVTVQEDPALMIMDPALMIIKSNSSIHIIKITKINTTQIF